MTKQLWKICIGVAAFAVFAVVGATVALAGSANTKTTAATATRTARSGETPLTGDVLAQVKTAAVAKVGGTVTSATTENDSSNSAAAYEVHVTKADGTHVKVILDKSYNVLSVETGRGHG